MSTSLVQMPVSQETTARKRFWLPLPKEGEDGLFTQSWYAICRSDEVSPGQVIGKRFLDGKVAIVRGESGTPQVLSAYCPHLGSDLSGGKVIGERVQCPFHAWQFDMDGTCVETFRPEPTPPAACLFKFPTVERYGMIWAFNGEEPHWQLPDMRHPDDDLHIIVEEFGTFPADPVAACANTPDYHHFRTIHGLSWTHPDPDADKDMVWTDHSFRLSVHGTHWNDWPFEMTAGINSTTLFVQDSTIDGKWFAYMVALTIREPGSCEIYNIVLTHRGDRSEAAEARAREIAEWAMKLESDFIQQDAEILANIRFRQGTLTKSDRPLAKYLDMVRAQPRGHPSAEFIR